MYLMVFLNVIIHGCQVGSRVVMALFAIKLGASPFAIGIMVALYSMPPLCFGVHAGRITDRYGVRGPMILGAILCGAGMLAPYLWPSIPSLYFSALTIGFSFMFYTVAVQNLTGAWGPREERAKNFSTLSLGYSISGLCGPVFAGYAIDFGGHQTAYLGFAISTLVPIVMLFGVGTLVGMMLITVALAAPFAASARNFPRFNVYLRVASGLLSVGFGLFLMVYIGWVDGLFTGNPQSHGRCPRKAGGHPRRRRQFPA